MRSETSVYSHTSDPGGSLGILGRAMWRRSRINPFLLWTVVLAVLAVRLTDTHLHLCFDGQEPPTSVHFADASVHHDDEHHDGSTHADKDINPFVGTLVKSDDDAQQIFALIASTLLTIDLLPRDSGIPPLERAAPRATDPPFYLRPPVRGPPA